MFLNNAITDNGTKLLAQIQAGATFVPTKIVVGSGEMVSGQTTKSVTHVIKPEQEIAISEVKKTPDESSTTISGIFTNKLVTEPFYYRELGLYAKGVLADGSETEEILYSYGNAGDNPDPIPAYSTETLIETILQLIVYVGNETKVTVEVDSEAYIDSITFKKTVADLRIALDKLSDQIGVICDKTTGQKYRLGVDGGLLYFEEVTE